MVYENPRSEDQWLSSCHLVHGHSGKSAIDSALIDFPDMDVCGSAGVHEDGHKEMVSSYVKVILKNSETLPRKLPQIALKTHNWDHSEEQLVVVMSWVVYFYSSAPLIKAFSFKNKEMKSQQGFKRSSVEEKGKLANKISSALQHIFLKLAGSEFFLWSTPKEELAE